MTEWWQPTFQTTIDAYYQGDLASGLTACERLLFLNELPFEIERQTRRNLIFYAPTLRDLDLVHEERRVVFPHADGWSLFNPSIAVNPESHGLTAIVRSSNYVMSPTMRYTIHDPDDIIRTTNYLLELTPDLDIRAIEEIDDRAIRPDPPPFPVSGFEDCRLVRHTGSWWVSATVRDRNPQGICQIALFRLAGDTPLGSRGAWGGAGAPLGSRGARGGVTPTDLHLLNDAAIGRHEKNWMPVAACGEADALRFIYGCFPIVVLRYDDGLGATSPEVRQPGPSVARKFSGGTQAIAVDGGHLALIHEAADFEDGGRVYTHRWVWFDAEWRLARLSSPFLLHERGIEFAAGLAQRGDELVVSYGVWDREAWLATLPLSGILSRINPPLNPDEIEAEMRAAERDGGRRTEDGSGLRLSTSVLRPPSSVSSLITRHPTIVSTTLSGNSEELIGDALGSVVAWVDWCLLIDTGISDDTLRIARAIAGDKLVVRQFPWQDDFAAARNVALQAAHELGADWAITLDTDERIDVGAVDLRAALAATAADSLHVKQANGTYGKERLFRLPARGQYAGPTHEAFIRDGGSSETLEGVVFHELDKSHEQYRRKAERDIAILTRHTAAHPDDPRWFYYLGDSYAGLDRHEEAIAAFRACASLNGWDEEGAWAMYRAAECLLKLGRPAEAIEACAMGMARHAGLAELPWLAAYAAWQAGRPAQAAYWARQSIAMGHFAGAGATVPRIGFRHPPALWEGPYDVLRFALRQLGDDAGADEAERRYEEAKHLREDGEEE
jgi:tetratricopeptide (TPR) repeat protein